MRIGIVIKIIKCLNLLSKKLKKKRSIGHVAKELGIQTHVIRFWETKFENIKPEIGKGNRRYYFAKDIETIKTIKHYLYDEGYTIPGLKKLLEAKSQGKRRSNKLAKITEDIQDNDQEINGNITFNSNNQEKINLAIKNIESELEKLENLTNIND